MCISPVLSNTVIMNIENSLPDYILKCSASYTNRRSKLGEIAREIVRELFLQLVQIFVLAGNDRAALRFSQLIELFLQTSRIGEFEQTNPAGLGAHDQRSQGTFHPVDDDAVRAFDMARRLAEGLPKGFAKA